jgi:hypothetical protein
MSEAEPPVLAADAESRLLWDTVAGALAHDLAMMKAKVLVVLNPAAAPDDELADWDLWGPFLLCVALVVLLAWPARAPDALSELGGVVAIALLGSCGASANLVLLGSELAFLQGLRARILPRPDHRRGARVRGAAALRRPRRARARLPVLGGARPRADVRPAHRRRAQGARHRALRRRLRHPRLGHRHPPLKACLKKPK